MRASLAPGPSKRFIMMRLSSNFFGHKMSARSSRQSGLEERRRLREIPAPQGGGVPLPPAKKPLYVGKLQLDIGRATVIACAGTWCRFHLSKERVHFLGTQLPARANRAVAGHGGGDSVEPLFQRVSRVIVRDLV